MKITKVYCEHYRWPKEKPIANGKHVYTHNELNRVCVETDEGITGYGSSWAVHNIEEIAAPIIGEDPLNTERLWSKLYVPKFLGRRGNTLWTISAIDIALWDIRSKVTKLPLYQLLGGYRESIPFYIAGGYYGPDKGIPELQKEMEQYVSWGAKAVKMKVGALSIKEDAARVKAVREVIGEDVKLLLDANCAYRPYEAIEFSRQVEEYCPLGEEGQKVMEQLYRTLQLSARVYHRILKTARTIADLEDREEITGEHLLEAACYRPSETYWN